MQHLFLRVLVFGAALACASCDHRPPQPAAPPAAPAQVALWGDSVASALKQAKAQNKDALLFFTGSDWAEWAQKLQAEVFDGAAFKAAAPRQFVLVALDFPQHQRMAGAVAAQNGQWMQKCGVSSLPTVVLVDADGRPYGQFAYQPGATAADYLKLLDVLRARRALRDEKLAAAANAQGSEKVVLIDDALRALDNNELVLRHYTAEIKQIIALDPTGQARVYFQRMGNDAVAGKKIQELMEGEHAAPEKAVAQLVLLAGGDDISKVVKQRAWLYAFRICQTELKDAARAQTLFDAALAADPGSEATAQLQANRARLLALPVEAKPENFVELKK